MKGEEKYIRFIYSWMCRWDSESREPEEKTEKREKIRGEAYFR